MVEHQLPKLRVASSSLVFRSKICPMSLPDTLKKRPPWVVFLILVLWAGCSSPPAQLSSRYSTLSKAGSPEKIIEEFSQEELVRQATVLFPYHTSYKKLHLHSDRPFEEADAVPILVEVQRRLSDSPIYNPEDSIHAFICNDGWKEELYMGGVGQIGGRAYFRTAPHVFFTKADVPNDALLSPAGRPIAPPRTFTYYLAHEFTHVMLGRHLGGQRFDEIPTWVFEGYPDYVGLGPGYTAEQARKAYEERDPRTHGTMAEDYLRYGLMVATYLESHDVQSLLDAPPDEASFSTLFTE